MAAPWEDIPEEEWVCMCGHHMDAHVNDALAECYTCTCDGYIEEGW